MRNASINAGLLKISALLALALASGGPSLAMPAISFASSGSYHGARGQRSINYSRRARRSHAGKPAGYVKAY